jgi:hypothetical protein
MRASTALWHLATFSLLSAMGCQSGARPNVWPWNKDTPTYSTWSKNPPAGVTQQTKPSLPSAQAGTPAQNGANAGYPVQTAGAGAANPNAYPAGAYPTGAYPAGTPATTGGYGQSYDQSAAGLNNAYGGTAGQSAGAYDRTADARYGNPPANPAGGTGYGAGSRYDATAPAAGDRYSNWPADPYAAPADQNQNAVLGDRYGQSSAGVGTGAPAGAANQPNSAWSQPSTPSIGNGYPPRSTTPGQSYRGTSNDVKPAGWRPGGTTDYLSAPTRAAFNGSAGDAGAQPASYNVNASRYGDNGASGADVLGGYDASAVGDRYGQPAASGSVYGQAAGQPSAATAGGFGQDAGALRR